uniref:G-patch domain-containing protein n=1 Tax=Erythrolobus australicus TaxID=1077150 RepID=A0A7S1TLJ2_9RHOD|eukprot:CAMPEP_0185832666 /NCGR_PEP_ID=MMETSP1353-20130828/2215_1 /TAXON_ID=1077150 /ORGANISM="Erythrolobus australicus, Strain CCMP3124" /LENGTH=257 /DNA_ID=CAMNT_0028530865 /DNA_START=33 /DNA_END=806 /DNA_ORIENTATION=+
MASGGAVSAGGGASVGERLLRGMGWVPGAGLGAGGDGRLESVQLETRGDERRGLGVPRLRQSAWCFAKEGCAGNWWESAFEQTLQKVRVTASEATRESAGQTSSDSSEKDSDTESQPQRDGRKCLQPNPAVLQNAARSGTAQQGSIFERCNLRRCRPGGKSKLRRIALQEAMAARIHGESVSAAAHSDEITGAVANNLNASERPTALCAQKLGEKTTSLSKRQSDSGVSNLRSSKKLHDRDSARKSKKAKKSRSCRN